MGLAVWRRGLEDDRPEVPLPSAGIRFRHCVTVFGEQRAPWRDSVAEAVDDAITLELASWDATEGRHFLAVPVDIKTERMSDAAGR